MLLDLRPVWFPSVMQQPSPSAPAVTILYIAGAGRSGSTILDNILGEVEGVSSVGELRFLWERGILEERLCGCGRPFLECPQWTPILSAAFPGADLPQLARRMVELQQHGTRARHLPKLLRRRSRERLQRTMSEYLGNLSLLYAATQAHLGCRVLVDSSKLPPYGALLEMLPGVEVRVVHLIRDPRATAYSWLRKKALPDRAGTAFMQQHGPVKAAGLWCLWNWAAGRLWRRDPDRYLRVHYEDFVREPRATVERILGTPASRARPRPSSPRPRSTSSPTTRSPATPAGSPPAASRSASTTSGPRGWDGGTGSA